MTDDDTDTPDEPVDDPFADIDGDGDGDADDPFADIEGVDAEDDPFTDLSVGDGEDPSDNTLFTDEAVTTPDDDDAVWSELEGEDGGGNAEVTPELDTESERVVAEAGDVAPADESNESVVKKRSYCERCEYFSEPPEVSCSYPESEIVELIDTRRFRVRNCPIVERRKTSDISSIAEGGGVAEAELEPPDTADSDTDD